MNGAVHGEATATANTPVSRWSASGCRAWAEAQDDGSSIDTSKTPIRFRAISAKSAASPATKSGDCSWNPQPMCSPPARSTSSAPAKARKLRSTPAV